MWLSFFLLMMCMTITSVVQPSSATVGEQMNIIVNVKVQPIDSDGYKLVFGFLAPISWDTEQNATATFTHLLVMVP